MRKERLTCVCAGLLQLIDVPALGCPVFLRPAVETIARKKVAPRIAGGVPRRYVCTDEATKRVVADAGVAPFKCKSHHSPRSNLFASR